MQAGGAFALEHVLDDDRAMAGRDRLERHRRDDGGGVPFRREIPGYPGLQRGDTGQLLRAKPVRQRGATRRRQALSSFPPPAFAAKYDAAGIMDRHANVIWYPPARPAIITAAKASGVLATIYALETVLDLQDRTDVSDVGAGAAVTFS